MDSKLILSFAAGALIGLGVGMLIPTKEPTPMGNGAEEVPSGKIAAEDVDRQFIVQMIPHHTDAIVMAEIALERETRPEIQSLANSIVDAQTQENEMMRTYFETWFGEAVPTDATPVIHHAGMEAVDLEALRTAENFDIAFIDAMIPHHRGAIAMAETLAATTVRPEMQTLANQIITSQAREIAMMESWRAEWSQ